MAQIVPDQYLQLTREQLIALSYIYNQYELFQIVPSFLLEHVCKNYHPIFHKLLIHLSSFDKYNQVSFSRLSKQNMYLLNYFVALSLMLHFEYHLDF